MQTTFLNYLYSFKEEVIGKTTLELKLFTEQENIGLTILINQMKSSRTLKLTYKVKKEIRLDINIFAETEIDRALPTNRFRHHRTQESYRRFKKANKALTTPMQR
jgi:hypothetical protein